jgi:acetolactate synthase-1/2/3 large subunit
MKVSDFILKFYSQKKIDKVFQVYGAATGELIDAFTRTKKIEYLCPFHEQAAGFMAEGYSKIKRLPGIALSTSGPGATNMITSAANCFYDSIPCIFLAGQINSQFMRPHKQIRQIGFQETDTISLFKPITKYAVRINNANNIKYELEKSYFIATSGRPGPVFIDIPINIQKTEIKVEDLEGFQEDLFTDQYNEKEIRNKIKLFLLDLKKSKRPSFLIGGGVQLTNTVAELNKLVKKIQIPSFVTWNAIDIIKSDSRFYGGRVGTYGGPGRNFGIQNTDLLFAIGSRVSGRITGGNVKSFARCAKKYVVDIDPYLLERKYQEVPFDVNIRSDLRLFFKIFNEELDKNKQISSIYTKKKWLNTVINWRKKYDPVDEIVKNGKKHSFEKKSYVHPYMFMNSISKLSGPNDIFVGDCGGVSVLIGHGLKTKKNQRYHSNNGHAPMGYAFAASIGSYFGSNKNCNVICLTGDGGFTMNSQELQMLKNYNIPVKTFIINNMIYGITKSFQKTNYEGREEACGPKGYSPPDFVKVADSYGIKTIRINNDDEINEKIKEVLKYKGPVVCDVNCKEFHKYEPKIIGWETPIEDMYPYLPRKEFKKNMYIKPLNNWKNPFMPSDSVKKGTME